MAEEPRYIVGDVWRLRRPKDFVVVPTNLGWTREGTNPMGRGVARGAAQRYADIPAWYGALCQRYGTGMQVCAHEPYRLIFFPTKPLARNPALSWKADASLDLIRKGRIELVALLPGLPPQGRVLLTALGCGAGNLDPTVVVPELLELTIYTPRVHLVLDEVTAKAAGLQTVTTEVSENTIWDL